MNAFCEMKEKLFDGNEKNYVDFHEIGLDPPLSI